MARYASSYRQARRAAWRDLKERGSEIPWTDFNKKSEYGVGSTPMKILFPKLGRSKYMPHIGKKQRAKGEQS